MDGVNRSSMADRRRASAKWLATLAVGETTGSDAAVCLQWRVGPRAGETGATGP